MKRSIGLGGLLVVGALLCLSACVTTTDSPHPKHDPSAEVTRRVDAANAYLRKGETDRAIEHLRIALKIDPESPKIHDALGGAFWTTGEYELAEQHFKKAIANDPKYSRARNNYAAFLYDRGRYKESLKQLEIVVADTLYDARSTAFLNLGKAYQKLGEPEKAEEAFTRSVKMDKYEWPAMVELADIHYGRHEYDIASEYYAQFKQVARGQSPRTLLLGIRLARATGDRDAEASYALQLKSLYGTSNEYHQYERELTGK